MSEAPRHLGARPLTLTQEFLAAAYDAVNQDDDVLIYPDADLLFAVNEKLATQAQI
jgi:hypothetical protein